MTLAAAERGPPPVSRQLAHAVGRPSREWYERLQVGRGGLAQPPAWHPQPGGGCCGAAILPRSLQLGEVTQQAARHHMLTCRRPWALPWQAWRNFDGAPRACQCGAMHVRPCRRSTASTRPTSCAGRRWRRNSWRRPGCCRRARRACRGRECTAWTSCWRCSPDPWAGTTAVWRCSCSTGPLRSWRRTAVGGPVHAPNFPAARRPAHSARPPPRSHPLPPHPHTPVRAVYSLVGLAGVRNYVMLTWTPQDLAACADLNLPCAGVEHLLAEPLLGPQGASGGPGTR